MTVLVGNTLVDGSANNYGAEFTNADYAEGMTFVASASGTANQIQVFTIEAEHSGRCAIYELVDGSWANLTLIAQTAMFTTQAASWCAAALESPVSIVSGQSYFLAWVSNASTSWGTHDAGVNGRSFIVATDGTINYPASTATTHDPLAGTGSIYAEEVSTAVAGIPADTLQYEGAAQANLTNLYVQIVTGHTGIGTQLYENTAATTDVNGVRTAIDISDSPAAVGDLIRVRQRTADGKSFEHATTVGDIS